MQVNDDILTLLKRIAEALEAIAGTAQKTPDYDEILGHISKRFGDKRELFAKIVHDNVSKPPSAICELLKDAGVLSQSTYWKDVRVFKRMAQKERERRCK